jgi:phage gpG-like protein
MITAALTGDADVAQKLDGFAARLQTELRSGLGQMAERLRQDIVASKLSGQMLQSRSGRLQRSVAVMAVAGEGDALSVSVTVAAPYAALHEYGFRGSETIRGHVRRITQAFGRPITAKAIDVRSYSRAVVYPERSFLRSALNELEASGALRAEVQAAIGRANA